MIFKEDVDHYDENSIFICWNCKRNPYRILRKKELKIAENDVVICYFCNSEVDGFKSISDCVKNYENQLKTFKRLGNIKVKNTEENSRQKEKFKENIAITKNIINELHRKQKASFDIN